MNSSTIRAEVSEILKSRSTRSRAAAGIELKPALDQARHGARQIGRVSRFRERSRLALADQLRDPRKPAGDHRKSAGNRLHQRHRNAVLATVGGPQAGQYERVCLAEQAGDLGLGEVAVEADPGTDPEVSGETPELVLRACRRRPGRARPVPAPRRPRRGPRAAPGGPCSPEGWRRRAGAPAPVRAAAVGRSGRRRGLSRSGRPRSAAPDRSDKGEGSAGCSQRSSPRSSPRRFSRPRKHCWTKMSWAWAVKL